MSKNPKISKYIWSGYMFIVHCSGKLNLKGIWTRYKCFWIDWMQDEKRWKLFKYSYFACFSNFSIFNPKKLSDFLIFNLVPAICHFSKSKRAKFYEKKEKKIVFSTSKMQKHLFWPIILRGISIFPRFNPGNLFKSMKSILWFRRDLENYVQCSTDIEQKIPVRLSTLF